MISFAVGKRQKIGDWLNGAIPVNDSRVFRGALFEKKKVLVLVDISSEKGDEAFDIIKESLKALCPSAEITFLCYYNDKSSDNIYISDTKKEYFSEKDFSCFFKIKNPDIRKHIGKKYDIAFICNSSNMPFIPYLAKYVDADLRVGTGVISDEMSEVMNYVVKSDSDDIRQCISDTFTTLAMMFGNTR